MRGRARFISLRRWWGGGRGCKCRPRWWCGGEMGRCAEFACRFCKLIQLAAWWAGWPWGRYRSRWAIWTLSWQNEGGVAWGFEGRMIFLFKLMGRMHLGQGFAALAASQCFSFTEGFLIYRCCFKKSGSYPKVVSFTLNWLLCHVCLWCPWAFI